MLALAVAPYRLPLAAPFVTAAGAVEHRAGLLVRLVDERTGEAGYGEVAPLPGHGGEPLEAARAALARVVASGALAEATWLVAGGAGPAQAGAWVDAALARDVGETGRDRGRSAATTGSERGRAPHAAPGLASPVAPDLAAWPCARAGLALALGDLLARRASLPLARWLAPDARAAVAVNATIGAVSPSEAARRASEAFAAGYRTLKIKVGDAEGSARVAAVRQAVRDAGAVANAARGPVDQVAPPPVRLRADANGAWDAARAPAELAALVAAAGPATDAAAPALELVEQPVPASAVEDLAALRRLAIVPVAADEALEVPGGWQRVLAAGAADILILKPTLLGGPLVAMAIAEAARAAGVGVVITTALDGAVGRMGALHVAAAVPSLAGACGLATGGLLAGDVADGPQPRRGFVAVPERPGIGLDPSRDGQGAPLAWQRP